MSANPVNDWGFPAPAKINLFLHVTGRRQDGYHLLETVFRFLNWGDSVQIMPRRDAELRLIDPLPGVPAEHDLCMRAARLLQAHAGCRLGADIRLLKRLPLGGGLGGGSSDAATVLLVLNRLWGLHLPRHDLQTLAVRLGAQGARVEYMLLLAAAFAAPLLMWLLGWSTPWVLLTWLSFFPARPTIRLALTGQGRILNQALAGTARLELIVALLFALGILIG